MTWVEWFERGLARYGSWQAYSAAWCAYHAPLYDAIVRACPPPAALLELGCGIGCSASALAGRGYGVVGVDRDEAVLALAESLSETGPPIAFCLGDEYSPAADGPYDVVTCLGLVEHLDPPDRRQLLRRLTEIAPVQAVAIPSPLCLEVDGQCAMGEQPIPLEQLAAECREAGMQILESFGWGRVEGRDGFLSFAITGARR